MSASAGMSECPSRPPEVCSTLVDLVRLRAFEHPRRRAYTFLTDGEVEGPRLTYAELDRQATAIGAVLQRSIVQGERALLLYPPGLDFVPAFFGCLYAGVVAVPAYPPHPARPDRALPRLRSIAADARPLVVLTTSPLLSVLEDLFAKDPDFRDMGLLATDSIAGNPTEEWNDPGISGNTLAFLQYTSGSTSAPKGVMVSHGNVLHNEHLIQGAFGQTERSVVVGWLPLYHDMGLIGNVLHPLYVGSRCVLMPPVAVLQRPVRWLQAISQYRATISTGPNFAYDLCVRRIPRGELAGLDLSSWSQALNGAEPVHHETLERFAAVFAPCGFHREAFHPCYGLAEATLCVSGGHRGAGPAVYTVDASVLEQHRVEEAHGEDEGARRLVSCGEFHRDQQIVIVNPERRTRCQSDEVGEIWVSGPSVALGYWNRPEETERIFRAYLADTGEGPFLRTGDLGFLKGWELFVTGRLKDLVIIRGRNHYPQDIERTAQQSHPALRPGHCVAFSVDVSGEERLVVLAEVDDRRYLRNGSLLDVAAVVESIREAVADYHELAVHAVWLLKAGSIPKTSSGKVQRYACRFSFLAESPDAGFAEGQIIGGTKRNLTV